MMSEHDYLAGSIEELRSFERDYRGRLRMYFEDRLAELDAPGGMAPLTAAVLRVGATPDADLAEALAVLAPRERDRLLTALLRLPVAEVTA